jgi:hypothetical protein
MIICPPCQAWDVEMKQYDPMAIVLSAIENASVVPVTADDVLTALRTGRGEPSHLRALFGDVAFESLVRVGIRYGISNSEIGHAYAVAVRSAGARNSELDDWCAENLESSPQP